jgi:hypothetical protein
MFWKSNVTQSCTTLAKCKAFWYWSRWYTWEPTLFGLSKDVTRDVQNSGIVRYYKICSTWCLRMCFNVVTHIVQHCSVHMETCSAATCSVMSWYSSSHSLRTAQCSLYCLVLTSSSLLRWAERRPENGSYQAINNYVFWCLAPCSLEECIRSSRTN